MSSPLQDGSIATNDVIEAVHINQLFPILADLEDGKAFFRPDQGSANAYQVDFSGTPSNKNQFSAYHQGMLVIFKAANTNTGASTLQVVGPSGNLTALPLTKSGSVALEADDIQAGQMVAAVCNDLGGGNFRFEMVGAPAVNLTAGDIPSGVDASKIGAGTVSNTEFGYLDGVTSGLQAQLDGKSTIPVGVVVPYAGASAPSGWLFCYGQNVSRTTYASLFAALGTTYGAGDGSTTFGLPDLRGRVMAGRDNMGGSAAGRLTNSGTGNPGIDGSTLGAAGGADRHSLSTAQMPSHNHAINPWATYTAYHGNQVFLALHHLTSGWSYTQNSGSGQAHPNVQPTLVTNYIIYAGV